MGLVDRSGFVGTHWKTLCWKTVVVLGERRADELLKSRCRHYVCRKCSATRKLLRTEAAPTTCDRATGFTAARACGGEIVRTMPKRTVARCCDAIIVGGAMTREHRESEWPLQFRLLLGQELPKPPPPPPAVHLAGTFGAAEGLDVEALVERLLERRMPELEARAEERAYDRLRRELAQHGSAAGVGIAASGGDVAAIMNDPPPTRDADAAPESGARKPTYLAGMRAALATAHRAAQERRYGGMGDDARNVRPEAWKAATALLEAVVAESGAELERAAGAVMTAYVAEPGRRDGGLVDERHPLDWFHYYAHKLKAPALAMLRRRRDEAPPDEHVVDHAAVMAELEAKRARMSGRAAA